MDSKTSSKLQKARSVNWGSQKQIQVPRSLFKSGAIELSAGALTTYIVLLYLYGRKPAMKPEYIRLPVAEVIATRKTLKKYTGYGDRRLDAAVKELTKLNLIETVRRRKREKYQYPILAGAAPNRYYLHDPETGDVLDAKGGGNVLYTNNIRYFTAPEVIISKPEQAWALAQLSSVESSLYFASLWLANQSRANSFKVSAGELRSMARITDKRTFEKSLDRLESLGLLTFKKLETVTRNSTDLQITLCDPTTGEPVISLNEAAERNPANYYVEGLSRSTKFILNMGTEEERERQLRNFLPPGTLTTTQGNGDISIQCPYHDDNTPSCSVSCRKSCFHCFGCGESGTLSQLLMKLKNVDTGAMMSEIGASRGETVTYHAPDKNALAKYDYRDADGVLIKQVLRYPPKDGTKVFRQRRPGKRGGWLWNTNGLGPLLYHTELLKDADVVCITEGEKDADKVTKLELTSSLGQGGKVIGVTSGGSETWDASLVALLKDKRVVVMPDADEAGKKFADAVTASLQALGTEYRVVTFDDVVCKDVSDYLEVHSSRELAERIGSDWVKILERPGTDEDMDIPI